MCRLVVFGEFGGTRLAISATVRRRTEYVEVSSAPILRLTGLVVQTYYRGEKYSKKVMLVTLDDTLRKTRGFCMRPHTRPAKRR
jgi:hypothetical protein